MDPATARERVFRLEEDRALLLAAWTALDALDRNAATECHRITRAPEFARTFQRIEEQLTALDTEQSALIESLQNADSGWKGGSSEGWVARLLNRHTWRRGPTLGALLYERTEQRAREMGLSVRQVIEAALIQYLSPRRAEQRIELPAKECEFCKITFSRGTHETLSGYRARRFCGNSCRALSIRGRAQVPRTDAEIVAAVREGGYRGARDALGLSQTTISRRLRRIRERERKAA